MITDGLTPFTVLLFLGGVAGAFALAGTYVFGRVTQRPSLQRLAARLFAAGTAIYVVVLLGVSIASSDRVLAPGESKHICEIDCHLAYSVVRTTSAPLEQNRIRHIVTVQVVFDKTTISSGRLSMSRSRPIHAMSQLWTPRAGPTRVPPTICDASCCRESRIRPTWCSIPRPMQRTCGSFCGARTPRPSS